MGNKPEPDGLQKAETRMILSDLRKKAVVAEAPEESAPRGAVCITKLFGKIRYDPQYDYKTYRSWR